MIEYLRGRLVALDDESIVLDVGGIGYRIFCPAPGQFRGCSSDDVIQVYTHLHVREDEWLLYGFAELAERTLFRQLMTVTGIGPKMAMAILAAASSREIAAAICQADLPFLTRLPGVGKKTAERLIVELKDKVTSAIPVLEPVPEGGRKGPKRFPEERSLWNEVAAGLASLGYREAEIRQALSDLSHDGDRLQELTVEEALRLALQRLARLAMRE
jgi:Holliday junction DNA helicase RuvA